MEEDNKIYICKHCCTDDIKNFTKGRYTTCKKCRNKSKNDVQHEKEKLQRIEEISIPKELEIGIEKFMITNYRVLGNTLKNLINGLEIDSKNLISDISNIKKEFKILENSILENDDIIFKLCEKFEALKEENESLSKRLEVLEDKMN